MFLTDLRESLGIDNRKGEVVLIVNKISSLYPKEVNGIVNWIL